jgi:hypothetical protein
MRIGEIFDAPWKTAASFTLLVAFAIGCGAVRNPALENARTDYHKAQQDPMIVRHAAAALDKAARALNEADQRWEEDQDIIEVEHLAYIAEKRVEIARATAQRRLAMEEIQRIRLPRP